MKTTMMFLAAAACAATTACTSAECPYGQTCGTDTYQPPPADNGPGLPPGACYTAANCEKQAGKSVNCVNGECAYTQIMCPDGFQLNALDECVRLPKVCEGVKPKQTACVDSIACDPDTGEWVVEPVECDDGDDLTDDSCDPVSGCNHEFNCGGTTACYDDNPCTLDYCDPEAEKCVNKKLCRDDEVCVAGICQFRCSDNTDCDDWNPCTMNTCDADTGTCSFPQFTCDDGDDTTFDACQVVAGKKNCVNVVTDCDGNGNDGNPCTDDVCKGAVWKHIAKSCGEGTSCDPETGMCEVIVVAICDNDKDCNDHNPCTIDTCAVKNGEAYCKHVAVECEAGQACDAGTGECFDKESPDCADDPLGSTCDDGNNATTDYCLMGECQHTQPVSCGEGTFLNPQSGECEPAVSDPMCQDGDAECVVFELSELATVATCLEGHWYVLQNCGPVYAGNYCKEETTGPACQKAATK